MQFLVDSIVNILRVMVVSVALLIWPAVIIAKLRNKHNRMKVENNREVYAKCILKESWLDDHIDLGLQIVIRDDKYRLVFAFEGEEKTFLVPKLVYDCVEEGDEGLLVFNCNDIVSFSDKIHKYEEV